MPYTKEEHQEVAAKAKRDQFGHFAKKPPEVKPEGVPPTQTVKVQVDVPSKQNTANSDQLVSLNIKNPLAILTRSFTKAINKPITIKIPPIWAAPILISLGVIPFSFFGLGKVV